MMTRARFLVAAEMVGFVAIAAAAALGAFALGGWVLGAVGGLLVAGLETVYLANVYADDEMESASIRDRRIKRGPDDQP